jgi:WD40 repeat protein
MLPCPSPEQLRRLLAGDLPGPDEGRVESHVEACPRCQETLDQLTAPGDGPSAELLANGARPRPANGTEAAALLRELKEEPPPEVLDAFAGRPRPAPPRPGRGPAPGNDWTAVAGYEVLGEVGRGGMGVVYQARQHGLNRLVALKMIAAGSPPGPRERERFLHEAEAVARLQHPNIVQIYEVGEDRGRPFLALEYVEGGSLVQKLHGVPQPARASAELVETLARAVHYAHQKGVIHRDLKPANVLLQIADCRLPIADLKSEIQNLQSAIPKITDFGLAKQLDAEPGASTQSGALVGTPSYMAPEQALGGADGRVTPAADVYSLGSILYELLTGRPPFRAASAVETVFQLVHEEPVSLARLQPKVPRDLETVCLKCLEKEPRKRYPTAEALADDLRRFLHDEPVRARPAPVWERAWKWARRRPGAAGLAAGALLAAVLGFGLVSWRWQEAEARAAAQAEAGRQAAARAEAEQHAREVETRARRAAERQRVGLLVDRYLALCEQGEVSYGLLGLAHALAAVPDDAPELRRVIRLNLAAWRYRLVSPWQSLWHDDKIHAVAYSPDGKTILTGSRDRTARRWDVGTGQPLGEPLRHDAPVLAVAYGPDGRVLLTASEDGTARLWDAATGRALGEPLRHDGPVRAVAFRPDGGAVLTGSEDGTARLWDAATGRPLGEPLRHEGPVRAVAFGPDGSTAATGSLDGSARLWDAADGRPRHPPLRHPFPVWALGFGPDGRLLLTGTGLEHQRRGEARLWDVASGQPVGAPLAHGGLITGVAWSPGGRDVLTGGEDWRASLWLAVADKPTRWPLSHEGDWVLALAFGPDGRTFVTCSYNRYSRPMRGEAKVFRAPPDQHVGPSFPHPGKLTAVAFSPDGRTVLTGGFDGTARLWDAASGRPLGEPLRHRDKVWGVAFSPDGKTAATAASDRTVRLWDAATGKPVGEPLPHPSGVRTVVFSRDGRILVTAGLFRTVYFWDAAAGRRLDRTLEHPDFVSAVAFSPDGKTLLTGGWDRTARLWDVATGKPLGEPLRHRQAVRDVAWAPDGKTVLTGCEDRTAQRWDVATGEPVGAPLLHPDMVTSVAFSPDGRALATACHAGTVQLWDAATGKPVGAPLLQAATVVAFHPDGGTVLAGGAEGTAQRWTMPLPVAGDPDDVLLWARVVVAATMDADGALHRLDPEALQAFRRRLQRQGGELP